MLDCLIEEYQKKGLFKRLIFSLLLITVFYAGVCTPLYLWANSNVLIAGGVFPVLWELVMQLVNYLFYWVGFAFLIYSIFRFGWKGARGFLITYAIIVVFRNLLNTAISAWMRGWTADEFEFYLPDVFKFILFDICMGALVFLFVFLIVRDAYWMANDQKRLSVLALHFPLEKMFDFKKKMLKAAFWCALIPSTVQILSRLLYDLAYGAPEDLADLLWIVAHYLSDIGGFLIGYFVIILILGSLHRFEERVETAEE